MDQQGFRAALGRFATGVTIVTTLAPDGRPVGVTANSFNSVSLDPPMVLWSLAKASGSMEAFAHAERFAVHVLGADQEAISNQFARRGADKFAGLTVEPTTVPLLESCAARFLCRTAHRYEGGDHIIFVGEVLAFEACNKPPLLYHGGSYAEARARPKQRVSGYDAVAGRITSDALFYLLAQAQHQSLRLFRGTLEASGMVQPRFLLMTVIAQSEGIARTEVLDRVRQAGPDASCADVDALIAGGWAVEQGGTMMLTECGRQTYVELVAMVAAIEEDVFSSFSDSEVEEGRRFLQHLVARTSGEIPALLAQAGT